MPGLNLIHEQERFKFEGDGFAIYYRRLPNAVRGRIMEKHSKRGDRANFNAATIEMLEYCIVGWEGFYTVVDGQRQDIPFSVQHVAKIPDEIQAELMELVGANTDRGAVEAGNSATTSGSSATTEA